MHVSSNHVDLLQAVYDLQGDSDDRAPSTAEVGPRLFAIYEKRGGLYFWTAEPPWYGTSPLAEELRVNGLLEIGEDDAGSEAVDRYYLSLTDEGREVLAGSGPAIG